MLYLEKLAAESLITPEVREQFINEYLDEANIRGRATKKAIRQLLMAIEDNQELVEKQWLVFKRQNCQTSLLKKRFDRFGRILLPICNRSNAKPLLHTGSICYNR